MELRAELCLPRFVQGGPAPTVTVLGEGAFREVVKIQRI